MRGAARSRDGVPIIALPSTAAGGAASRIMPELGRGGAVVTSRWAGWGRDWRCQPANVVVVTQHGRTSCRSVLRFHS